MTGTDDPAAGLGHNSGEGKREEVVWERWTKKRVFVRALEGTYGDLVRELFTQPRVYHAKDWKWKGGPQNYGKKIINPQAVKVAQSIECHIDVYAPGGYGWRHSRRRSAPSCRPRRPCCAAGSPAPTCG